MKTIILDIVFLAVIVIVGWFLIGYYLDYNYLATGYQDWMYHAFRIKSIEQWGIVSWDHKWANGINYWKMYQYLPHVLTLYTAKAFDIGITNAMILWNVTIFIYLRFTSYLLLRYAKVSSYLAFAVVLLSYSFRQNWIGISDYSIYIAYILFPLIIYISLKSIQDNKYLVIFGGLSGIGWLLHPIFGLFTSSLYLFISFAVTKYRIVVPYIGLLFLLLSALPYWIQFVLLGYNFANPYHTTTAFLKEVTLGDYFRLGVWYILLFAFSFIVAFIVKTKNSVWTKAVGVYILFFLFLFILVQYEYSPFILNKLQFSRINLFFGLLIPMFIGMALDPIVNITKSRFIMGIYVIIVAILISNAISSAQVYTPVTINKIENPVDRYLSSTDVNGSVYFNNDSETSYFTDWNVRLVGSYNEHLLPSPLSIRYKQLMSGGKSHLIVSSKQIDLVNAYSKVLGVEYLVLPIKSPITKSLLSSDTKFIFESDVEVDSAAYSVFRNGENISYAYLMERSVFDENISMTDLEKPSLNSASYDTWDEEIKKVSKVIDSDSVKVLDMEFINTDELVITVNSLTEFNDPVILVTQSFDSNWKVVNNETARITPTSLRFMKVEVGKNLRTNIITLKNSWPDWHWPVQYLGFGSVLLSGISVGLYEVLKKKNEN